jgi:hypothetical protein
VFERLAANGDRFSQVAAVELGLSLLGRFPPLETSIFRIVKAILADDPDDEQSRLRLTGSLVICVDGELARIGILRDKPAFWRRLASIAQASLIEREIVRVGVGKINDFANWAIASYGQLFFLQTLVDLHREPRWLPDFIGADQLKQEFLGRIFGAGIQFKSAIRSNELRELITGNSPGSVQAAMKPLLPYLPGPLEAGTQSPLAFPDDLAAELRQPGSQEPLRESALAGIVNMALVYRIEGDHARVVTDALRRTKYQLSIGTESQKIFSLLSGLAMVAAVTRSPELANEIRLLARVQRRRSGVVLRADHLMRIGFIAAASESDLDKWSVTVGDWLTEVSSEDIDRETARAMRDHIRRLCDLVPSLWRTCVKAHAAFSAVAGMAA